jgi:hypothetical protein
MRAFKRSGISFPQKGEKRMSEKPERFNKVNSCLEIIRKKLVNFPVTGFTCRKCREYVPWRPPKKAMIAKHKRFRKTPVKKIPETVALLKPPIYCRDCIKKLGLQ